RSARDEARWVEPVQPGAAGPRGLSAGPGGRTAVEPGKRLVGLEWGGPPGPGSRVIILAKPGARDGGFNQYSLRTGGRSFHEPDREVRGPAFGCGGRLDERAGWIRDRSARLRARPERLAADGGGQAVRRRGTGRDHEPGGEQPDLGGHADRRQAAVNL